MNEKTYATPAATFAERAEDYELKVTLPGIGKEDVELHVEGRTLTLKTATKYQNPAGFKLVASEFERTDHALSLDLPEMADISTLSAKCAAGVLTVTVRKRPETQPRKIEIG